MRGCDLTTVISADCAHSLRSARADWPLVALCASRHTRGHIVRLCVQKCTRACSRVRVPSQIASWPARASDLCSAGSLGKSDVITCAHIYVHATRTHTHTCGSITMSERNSHTRTHTCARTQSGEFTWMDGLTLHTCP